MAAMAELRWSVNDLAPLTFRELFIVYQNALESRWTFQAALLSEVHNSTVANIRLNSRAKPKMTTPADFNPCLPRRNTNIEIHAGNFLELGKQIGDQFLHAQVGTTDGG